MDDLFDQEYSVYLVKEELNFACPVVINKIFMTIFKKTSLYIKTKRSNFVYIEYD